MCFTLPAHPTCLSSWASDVFGDLFRSVQARREAGREARQRHEQAAHCYRPVTRRATSPA